MSADEFGLVDVVERQILAEALAQLAGALNRDPQFTNLSEPVRDALVEAGKALGFHHAA